MECNFILNILQRRLLIIGIIDSVPTVLTIQFNLGYHGQQDDIYSHHEEANDINTRAVKPPSSASRLSAEESG